MDAEKTGRTDIATRSQADALHEHNEDEGYILRKDGGESGDGDGPGPGPGPKLAPNGLTILIPQPSDDADDPVNWPWRKKHLCLLVVALAAFLPDFGSATGAVTLIPQAQQWRISEDTVNHSQAGNVFTVGAGGLFAVALSAYFGRLPVVFWFLLVALVTAVWEAGTNDFESFMAARILNGLFSSVSQAGGLMFIQDMFFFHERARKINVWASFFIISPYVGPLLAAFELTTQTWHVPFWVYTAMTAAAWVLVILVLDETYYDRTLAPAAQPPRGSRLARLTGAAQWQSRHLRNRLGQACWRTVGVLGKPVVLLTCFYYVCTFAWVIGINTTLAMFVRPLYGFGTQQIGYFYFTPIVAVVLAELAGHWLHDRLARAYMARHHGRFEPEVRLRAVCVALPLMVLGLVLIGQSLGQAWHYMATAVSWGLYVFGIMLTTTALSSYMLDCYPEASGEVSAWLNFSRTLGGFIVSYFQVTWANDEGTETSFGIQAAIVAAVFLVVLVPLMRWGKQLRVWSGPLNFATA